MKSISTFIGIARISRRDSHTYFDWIFNYTYSQEKESNEFLFAENYQIENFCFEELIKRLLILDIEKKDPYDTKFFFERKYEEAKKFLERILHRRGKLLEPRDDLFLQLNVKLFSHDFVIFDFLFFGYKYVLRDIKMPMELYNEFVDRGRPIIRFMKDFKVFIAHASEDNALAEKLADDLTKKGFQVWFDEWEIKVGDSIVDMINHGITETAFMVVLFSNNSVDKPWVVREMNAGFMRELGRKKVYVLPALIEKCQVPPLFQEKHYADFTISYEEGISEIIKAL